MSYHAAISQFSENNAEFETDSIRWPPAKRNSVINLNNPQITLYNSLQLNHCKLGQLVAQRNSSLGNVLVPANELLHNIEVLQAIPQCIENQNISEDLALTLQEMASIKTSQISAHIHNFIVASEAMQNALTPSSRTFSRVTTDDSEELQALAYVAQELNNMNELREGYAIDKQTWNESLQTLHRGSYLPQLWMSITRSTEQLRSASQQLQELLQESTCTPSQYEAFQQIMTKFNEQISPLVTSTIDAGEVARESINTLKGLVQHAGWQQHLNFIGNYQALQQAFEQHQSELNQLQRSCST
ncbi:DUF3080 family protein [Aliidiomarina sp. B3213]|uniref:DUF3080 family protein n=1 Tax=Aliidiomarina sp. B3213 TaxID=2249757 RepID=UPI0014038CFE|nr:DUF3080 family protein [Aliidiomarina sp. B3213]